MNIETKFNAMCVGKNESKTSDGKTTFYTLAIVQNGQAGNVSCSPDVYDRVLSSGQPIETYDFTGVYRDGQYKGFRIVGAGEAGSLIGGSAPQSASTGKGK
ncbi:hypothetical protein [Jutongia sp.]|uniref:hypothetical protein n=1 Tax=Jutongia sp. TaxID=2944204 RepID=UPI0030809645